MVAGLLLEVLEVVAVVLDVDEARDVTVGLFVADEVDVGGPLEPVDADFVADAEEDLMDCVVTLVDEAISVEVVFVDNVPGEVWEVAKCVVEV